MDGVRKLAFVSMVCFFGGTSVFVAGVDLQKRLARPTPEQGEEARQLIESLRGEVLAHDHPTVVHPSVIPARKGRGYLAEGDKNRIKKFLGGLFGGEKKDETSADQPTADNHVPSESVAPSSSGESPETQQPEGLEEY